MNYENLRRKNFAPEEFFRSEKANELKISNIPPKEHYHAILPCLMSTADMAQEFFDVLLKEFTRREIAAGRLKPGDKIVGFYVKINSGYRCKIVNDAVGSSDISQHLQGLAIDVVCPKFGTPEQIMKFLFSIGFVVDQCFCEGSWLHMSRNIVIDRNRMMYGYYLPDKKTGKRKFRALKKS
jgi:hypothetical protein